MYQWVDPATRITQLSGKPPVWYRSSKGGPRVIVFENNRVVDDTSIAVSAVEQERLRRQAFLEAETSRESAKEKLLQAKRLQAISELMSTAKDEDAAETPAATQQAAVPVPIVKNATAPPDVSNTAVVDQMRKLIEDWEKKNAESAKAVIEPGAPVPR